MLWPSLIYADSRLLNVPNVSQTHRASTSPLLGPAQHQGVWGTVWFRSKQACPSLHQILFGRQGYLVHLLRGAVVQLLVHLRMLRVRFLHLMTPPPSSTYLQRHSPHPRLQHTDIYLPPCAEALPLAAKGFMSTPTFDTPATTLITSIANHMHAQLPFCPAATMFSLTA